MRRTVAVIDPVAREVVGPLEYARRTRGRDRCRIGSPQVIADLADHRHHISPVDGSYITSRRERLEHNKRNHVFDVGNDPAYECPSKPSTEMDFREDLREAMHRPLPAVRETIADAELADSFNTGS